MGKLFCKFELLFFGNFFYLNPEKVRSVENPNSSQNNVNNLENSSAIEKHLYIYIYIYIHIQMLEKIRSISSISPRTLITKKLLHHFNFAC